MWLGKSGNVSNENGADRATAHLSDLGDTIGFLHERAAAFSTTATAPAAVAQPQPATDWTVAGPDALPYSPSAAPTWLDLDFGRKPPKSPSANDEIAFINGIDGTGHLTNQSFWGANGVTAFKWGSSTQGTGATISYSFDKKSHFSAQEKSTFLKAFSMWESVADVHFVEVKNHAGVVLTRGHNGAYTTTPTSKGSGTHPGSVTGQALISIDTSAPGFDLSGSLDKYGGYGMQTIIHEVGHLLGLGHGGAYNGTVKAKTDQFSAFDDRQYTVMSYISYINTDAKFAASNPWSGTDWGTDKQGNLRQASHTVQVLDILAIQQLYGASQDTPLSGGQTYGFHSNIKGPLHDFFDFTVNTSPVVTLFNEGTNNILDLTGYGMDQYIDLRPTAFSSVGGLVNNVCIAAGTDIGTAYGGTGNDTMVANELGCVLSGNSGNDVLYGLGGADLLSGDAGSDVLIGGLGKDLLAGGDGADLFVFGQGDSGKNKKLADEIIDFSHSKGDKIDLSGIDAIKGTKADDAFTFIGSDKFSHHAGELHFQVIKGDLFLSGDITGNGKADFMIKFDDVTTINMNDFFL